MNIKFDRQNPKHIIAAVVASLVLVLILVDVVRADTLYFTNGGSVEVPAGYKAVFVPQSYNGKGLIDIKLVDTIQPVQPPVEPTPAPSCTPAGELALGPSLPCEE